MGSGKQQSPESPQAERLYGLAAEYDNVDSLLAAAARVRDAGYSKWDAHTPFPVHGLDQAMGIKPTILPWITLALGLTGLGCAILLQWWTNAFDYPFLISGKPIFSLPANIPVGFELTVLFSVFATFFGALGLNKLPELFHPVHTLPRFARATSDRFFVVIEAGDRGFDRAKTEALLRSTGASVIEEIMAPAPSTMRFPRMLIWGGVIMATASLVPLALAARARVATSTEPRIHIIPDMDSQPKYRAQATDAFFPDGRAMRIPPDGTVAYGELNEDDAFYRGRVGEQFVAAFPEQLALTPEFMARGQERFRIYCSPCHGLAGDGDGAIAKRADALGEGAWITPTSVHAAHVVAQPVGQIFNTISNGIRNMPAYGPQIPVEDRWAIALYVRALQRSRDAAVADVPADVLPTLK